MKLGRFKIFRSVYQKNKSISLKDRSQVTTYTSSLNCFVKTIVELKEAITKKELRVQKDRAASHRKAFLCEISHVFVCERPGSS
jgi:hypothetical protein